MPTHADDDQQASACANQTVTDLSHFLLSVRLAKSAGPVDTATALLTPSGGNFVSRIFERCAGHLHGRRLHYFASALAALVVIPIAAATAADNPFSSLNGTWNGSGTASFDGGKTESLRCKGYYTGGGDSLGLSIRCANASAKVELRANLKSANGNVSGDWEERTYNQSGTVAGKASSGGMNLSISGGIQGSMSVKLGGGGHQVRVSTGGPTLKGINISMSR